MEHGSVREDDRPYVRPNRNAEFWVPALAILMVVLAAIAYYLLQSRDFAFRLPTQRTEEPVATPPAPPPAAPAPEPAIRHPLEPTAQAAPPSLPTLENSDSMMRESVAGLIGHKAFADKVIPGQLVRRIVATIDNLPRPTAPRRMMPLQPVPGSFAASGGEEGAIETANFARYTPYVRVLEALDAHALVQSYVRAYPLFQRAYEELGFPGKYFNDRLMQALDDMLAAPEVDGPLQVIRPKVLYEFADPDLETRSAGQKVVLRMGKENALRVKAKLAAIRRELIAAGKQR